MNVSFWMLLSRFLELPKGLKCTFWLRKRKLWTPFFDTDTWKHYSRGYIWARGEKIRGNQIFADLASIWPKWSGSKRILITLSPNTKSPHHIYRPIFGILQKTIENAYKMAPTYVQKLPINCLNSCLSTQYYFFVLRIVFNIFFKYFFFENLFRTSALRENRRKNGKKQEKRPFFDTK